VSAHLSSPLQHTIITGFDSQFQGSLDRKEPAAVHAALARHVNPRANHWRIDVTAHVIQTINFSLWRTDVPEEIHLEVRDESYKTTLETTKDTTKRVEMQTEK
jgi:hypothetical protein